MRFLTAIIDAMVAFVQRNPLTVLCIALLGLVAPALLQGIAEFILYAILGFVCFIFILVLVFRWKIYRLQKQMKDQFGGNGPQGGFGADGSFKGFGSFGSQGGFGNRGGASSRHSDRRGGEEGDVKIYTTSATPGKRVSENVGDYVEFEETKDEK